MDVQKQRESRVTELKIWGGVCLCVGAMGVFGKGWSYLIAVIGLMLFLQGVQSAIIEAIRERQDGTEGESNPE